MSDRNPLSVVPGGMGMDDTPSFVGVLGYRRSRHNILGAQARLVTIRGGVLRVSDREGEKDESIEVSAATVTLKRGMVEVVAGERKFYLYGLGQPNKIARELIEQAGSEPADVGVGLAPGGLLSSPLGAAAISRVTFQALLAAGARER